MRRVIDLQQSVGVLALLLLASGCGDAGAWNVSGQVRQADGSPLVDARIIARSNATGASTNDTTDAEGRYVLSHAEPGDYRIVVIEKRIRDEPRQPSKIASKYSDPETSGLAVSVKAGESKTLDLELEGP